MAFIASKSWQRRIHETVGRHIESLMAVEIVFCIIAKFIEWYLISNTLM